MLKILFTLVFAIASLSAWEDHADVQDHSNTDRIFKAVQKMTDCDAFETRLMEEEEKEALDLFRRTKKEMKNRRGYVLEKG